MNVQNKSEPETEMKTKKILCSDCFSSIGAGLPHQCGKETAVSNLIGLPFDLGYLQAEQVAAGILKRKMETDKIAYGSNFYISTRGKPLTIKVGTPENH